MREYIKPETEIIPSAMTIMASGVSGVNDEVGNDDEFTNTSNFETDLQQVESKSLWED
jgi:hypothetical protein